MHETIAECMIFANACVADRISNSLPTSALLRRHPPPLAESLSKLVDCASVKGWKLKTNCNKALSESLDACVDADDPSINKVMHDIVF